VKVEPYPYTARAWWGEAVVAESDACLLVETQGAPSVLYFPESAINLSALDGDGARDAVSLMTERADPPALAGHGAFDTERALVRVEVLDGLPVDDARDVTVKAFPTWGDARDLIRVMDVQPDGDRRYIGAPHTDGRRPVVEGSQMLGQAVVAAGRHAPERRAVAGNMLFLRGADAGKPLHFELDELSAGRTFTGLAVRVLQDGRCCAAGTLLLDATAPAVVRHAADAPDVPSPYECPPNDMGVTGRDLRVVDGAYTSDPDAPIGPPVLDCWVRFRDVPDDPALHAGLLVQFMGHMPIAAGLRPHAGVGQAQAHRTLSTGINAINLSLHGPVRADEWMLYHHLSTFAGDGMTHAECRVHTGAGLVASFSVDAMVRPFTGGTGRRDDRTAL
jgi:acyl-CoA thioesterase II